MTFVLIGILAPVPFKLPVRDLSTDAVPIKKGVLELVARFCHTIHQPLPNRKIQSLCQFCDKLPTDAFVKKCKIGKMFDLNEQLGLPKFCC